MVDIEDIEITKGDTNSLILTITENGSAYNLTGCTIFFTAKNNKTDTDAQAVITKTVTSHTNAVGGISTITLSATESTVTAQNYFYDIQLKASNGDIFTIVTGTLIVVQDITTRTT